MNLFTLCTMVERRLTWLAVIVLFWGAAIFYKSDLAADLSSPRVRGKARARQEVVVEIPRRAARSSTATASRWR